MTRVACLDCGIVRDVHRRDAEHRCLACYRAYLRSHPAPKLTRPRANTPVATRFWQRVDQSAGPDGCWPWKGARTHGYGSVRGDAGKNVRTHRVAWELTNGPITDGLSVLHRCDNPPCVNPAHLFLGTVIDNNRDMVAKGRQRGVARPTHCIRGHEYTPDNSYIQMRPGHGANGSRSCRRCSFEKHQRQQLQRRRERVGVDTPQFRHVHAAAGVRARPGVHGVSRR